MAMLAVTAAVLAVTSARELPIDVTQELGMMAHEIAKRHFAKSRCLAFVTENSNDIVNYVHVSGMPVGHVHLPLSSMKDSRRLPSGFEEYAWDTSLLSPMDAGCLAFIIQTSDVTFMVKTFARLAHSPKSIYRANRRFLYLPSTEVSEDAFESSLRELYMSREMDFLPDVVIAKVETEQSSTTDVLIAGDRKPKREIRIELITHHFTGPNPSERVTLDAWVRSIGFVYNADLYPDKVSNLMGKQINLTAIFYPPLSVVHQDADPPVYDGVEFQVMFEWQKKNNFSWGLVYEPEEWWGAIWDNGSGTGLSGHVSMDKADVGFGAIYLWENEYRFTDYSTVYFRTSLTTVLPKPKLLPGWLVAIHPFNINMWIAVAVSIVASSTVLHITSQATMRILGTGRGKVVVNMYSTWLECAFRTVGLLVLQVPPDERDSSTPRHVPMRHLVTWLILFYFVVTTGYSAGLASVLTLPRYEPPIETPVEMADRNVKFGGSDVAYVFFLQKSLDPKMRKLASNFIEADVEFLTEKATTGEMGFVIERMQNGHFFLPSYINEDTMRHLRVMKEDYVYGHCVFSLRKGSPYKDILNSAIHKVRDTGLVLAWEDRTVRRYMSTRRQHSVINSRKDVDPGPTQLLIRHVVGSFYLLGYGLAASLLAFILEIMKYIFSKQKNKKIKTYRSKNSQKFAPSIK